MVPNEILLSFREKLWVFQNNAKNDFEDTANSILKKLFPDQDLEYHSLEKRHYCNDTRYYHPVSGDLVANYKITPAHKISEKINNGFYRRTRFKEIDQKDELNFFTQGGFVHARVSIENLKLPYLVSEKIKVITSITEYYPPRKKSEEHYKTSSSQQRYRDLSSKRARQTKQLFKADQPIAGGDNGKIFKNITDDFKAVHLNFRIQTGPVQYQKIFRLPEIGWDNFKYINDVSLRARLSKDQRNNLGGGSIVLQYAGKSYTEIVYNGAGAKLSQKTYGTQGEIFKSRVEADSNDIKKKNPMPKPNDKAALRHARNRHNEQEDVEIRKLFGLPAFFVAESCDL